MKTLLFFFLPVDSLRNEWSKNYLYLSRSFLLEYLFCQTTFYSLKNKYLNFLLLPIRSFIYVSHHCMAGLHINPWDNKHNLSVKASARDHDNGQIHITGNVVVQKTPLGCQSMMSCLKEWKCRITSQWWFSRNDSMDSQSDRIIEAAQQPVLIHV